MMRNFYRDAWAEGRCTRGIVTRSDPRDVTRILCGSTQGEIRQIVAASAICRQSQQTEFRGAFLQEDGRGRAHRETSRGHGQVSLWIVSVASYVFDC